MVSVLRKTASQFQVGETGVYRDTGSKGTVGGKIEDVHKIKKKFSMLFKYVEYTLA
jgi:hypothetical protein